MAPVRIQCPVCKKTRSKEITKKVDPSKGIASVLIPSDAECPHTLVAFIDSQMRIRRVQLVDFAPTEARRTEVVEVMQGRVMTLKGARRVFGPILTDMISAVLQQKSLHLCGDIDAGISAYGVLNRIFPDVLRLGENIIITEDCSQKSLDALVINVGLPILVSGELSRDAHEALENYLREAETVEDNEAIDLLLRRRIAILNTVIDMLIRTLKTKTTAKAVIKNIEDTLHVKIKSVDLHAVQLLLRVRGHSATADYISFGALEDF